MRYKKSFIKNKKKQGIKLNFSKFGGQLRKILK
jgi:hypothetical protein